MGFFDLIFGGRKRISPNTARRLENIKKEWEECLAILNSCQTRDEVVNSLKQVSKILSQSTDQLPEARMIGISAKVLAQLSEICSEEEVYKNRDTYIRKCEENIFQINEILSE